jgi:septal ring factor EnvC (AmiA/AmiB activator)
MFELLQANQHTKTGVSQMAVFNDLNAVKSAVAEYKATSQAHREAHNKYDTAIRKLEAERERVTNKTWQAIRDAKKDIIKVSQQEALRINGLPDISQQKKEAAQLRSLIREGEKIMPASGMDITFGYDVDLVAELNKTLGKF